MKILRFIIFLHLLCSNYAVKAQNLLPSTVGQIFNFEKGDSLEYREWTVESGSCGCDWYELKTVDSLSYSSIRDTFSIFFHTQLVRSDSGAPINQCGQCQQGFVFGDVCPINANRWTLTNPDTSIVSFLNTNYQSQYGRLVDSCYVNNQVYDGNKQNFYYLQRDDLSHTQEIYVDSIGIVFKQEDLENMNGNIEQLIYYHKANGKVWGTPFFEVGIEDIAKKGSFSLYPNPADNRFIIRADLYAARYFKLFDAIGKQVMQLSLSGNETEINRNNLPAGIYFWEIASDEDVIKTGKLVME